MQLAREGKARAPQIYYPTQLAIDQHIINGMRLLANTTACTRLAISTMAQTQKPEAKLLSPNRISKSDCANQAVMPKQPNNTLVREQVGECPNNAATYKTPVAICKLSPRSTDC